MKNIVSLFLHRTAILISFAALCLPIVSSGQRSKIDSLLHFLKTAKEDTAQVNALNELSGQYMNTGSYQQAMQYALQAQQQGEKLVPVLSGTKSENTIKKGLAAAYNNIGRVSLNKSDFGKAMENFLISLKIKEEIKDKKGIANAYNNIGIIYWNKANYEKAIEYQLKALKIREEIGDRAGIAMSSNNIGTIYLNQGKNEKALENFQTYLKTSKEIGDKKGINDSYNNIGNVYYIKGIAASSKKAAAEFYQKALDNFFKSLELSKEGGNRQGLITAYNNIGVIYFSQGDSASSKSAGVNMYEKALENYLKSLKICEEIGDKNGIINSYNNLGSVYSKQDKLPAADFYLNKALILSKEIGKKEGIKQAYSLLAGLAEKKNDFKEAYSYYKLFSETKDSIFNEQASKQITEMNTKYDTEKKDKSIQLLNKDKERQSAIAEAEHRKQLIIIFSVSAFAVLIFIFALFIYRSFRQKRRLNIELEKLSIVASETDNGVLICGPKGELEWCNAGITRLLGFTFDELKQKGSTLEEISSNPDIKSVIHQSIENKKPAIYQSLSITKDGRKRWMQSTLTPILDDSGNIKKLVVIDTDVTERRIAEDEIKQKNINITDSINYAQRIQQAILPAKESIDMFFQDSFILFSPKNIVSGDFYWLHPLSAHQVLLAAVDCTGHGVPGALMSIMGYNLLEQAVTELPMNEPAAILDDLSKAIIKSLKQTNETGAMKDSMDIALCKIDFQEYELEFAGAHNSLYLIRNGILTETKADRRSIGITMKNIPFTNHKIKIEKGDSIYIFSDGFVDQEGGPEKKKFLSQPFRELLVKICPMNMNDQKLALEKVMSEWINGKEQIDDILIIGIRI